MHAQPLKLWIALGITALIAGCDQPAPPAPGGKPPDKPIAAPPPAAVPAVPVTQAQAPTPPAAPVPPAPAAPAVKPKANTHALPADVLLAPAPKAMPLRAPAKADGLQAANFIGAIGNVPTSWQVTPPANSMRVMQFVTPAAKNGEKAEMVVFFFAAGRGGSPEDNIQRWKSQFVGANGAPIEPKVSRTKVGEMPVIRVELAGTYSRGVGMGSESQAKADQILLVAIVTTPSQGNLTLHFFGHNDAVAMHRAAFEDVVASLKPSGH